MSTCSLVLMHMLNAQHSVNPWDRPYGLCCSTGAPSAIKHVLNHRPNGAIHHTEHCKRQVATDRAPLQRHTGLYCVTEGVFLERKGQS